MANVITKKQIFRDKMKESAEKWVKKPHNI